MLQLLALFYSVDSSWVGSKLDHRLLALQSVVWKENLSEGLAIGLLAFLLLLFLLELYVLQLEEDFDQVILQQIFILGENQEGWVRRALMDLQRQAV